MRIALRLQWDVVVGDGGEHLHIAKVARQLEVELAVEHQVLVVAEGEATGVVAIVVQAFLGQQGLVQLGIGVVSEADKPVAGVLQNRGINAGEGGGEVEGEDTVPEIYE